MEAAGSSVNAPEGSPGDLVTFLDELLVCDTLSLCFGDIALDFKLGSLM